MQSLSLKKTRHAVRHDLLFEFSDKMFAKLSKILKNAPGFWTAIFHSFFTTNLIFRHRQMPSFKVRHKMFFHISIFLKLNFTF